jgi:hypothetical protein
MNTIETRFFIPIEDCPYKIQAVICCIDGSNRKGIGNDTGCIDLQTIGFDFKSSLAEIGNR